MEQNRKSRNVCIRTYVVSSFWTKIKDNSLEKRYSVQEIVLEHLDIHLPKINK